MAVRLSRARRETAVRSLETLTLAIPSTVAHKPLEVPEEVRQLDGVVSVAGSSEAGDWESFHEMMPDGQSSITVSRDRGGTLTRIMGGTRNRPGHGIIRTGGVGGPQSTQNH